MLLFQSSSDRGIIKGDREMVHMAKRKPLQELTLKDDYMFYAVFHDEKLLKPLLEELLAITIQSVKVLNRQMTQKNSYEGKGIRLDIYCEDDEGRVFNVEMEARKKGNVGKRSRYYVDTIDETRLKEGAMYNELPTVYVIFVTDYDPFGAGRRLYRFTNRDEVDPSIRMDDGVKHICLNLKGTKGRISKSLRSMIYFLNSGKATDGYTTQLEKAVAEVKGNEYWGKDYQDMCLFEMDARIEGREEGKKEGSISFAEKLIARGKESLEEIADLTELPLETVKKLAAKKTA